MRSLLILVGLSLVAAVQGGGPTSRASIAALRVSAAVHPAVQGQGDPGLGNGNGQPASPPAVAPSASASPSSAPPTPTPAPTAPTAPAQVSPPADPVAAGAPLSNASSPPRAAAPRRGPAPRAAASPPSPPAAAPPPQLVGAGAPGTLEAAPIPVPAGAALPDEAPSGREVTPRAALPGIIPSLFFSRHPIFSVTLGVLALLTLVALLLVWNAGHRETRARRRSDPGGAVGRSLS